MITIASNFIFPLPLATDTTNSKHDCDMMRSNLRNGTYIAALLYPWVLNKQNEGKSIKISFDSVEIKNPKVKYEAEKATDCWSPLRHLICIFRWKGRVDSPAFHFGSFLLHDWLCSALSWKKGHSRIEIAWIFLNIFRRFRLVCSVYRFKKRLAFLQ